MTAATQPSIEQIVLGAIPVCGSTRNVEVGHMDGHEENTAPANLIWNCRSCNTRIGEVFKRAGLGRRTRQYNPAGEGANNLGEWMNAVMSMNGDPGGNMRVEDAVAMIHATPPEQRSRFAKEIWNIRKRRYGATGREEVPF
jgi:hypothetical protein